MTESGPHENEPEESQPGESEPDENALGENASRLPAAAPAESVDTLAAALRRDAADLEIYGQVLSGSLAAALPPGSITLDRRRTLSDRLAGREGRVERVEIALEDERLTLTLTHGHPVAEVAKVVRGVVLSRTPVAFDEWTRRLAAAMAARSRSDAEARAALEKLILEG
ncbi:hypothetical protein OG349_15905 [Streptomyces sp. NBC_01317]|uniref:hypothetical protein n=1 Tax=Streptomyces sp. NBC_01317 TaxID=2903822 RepID=UPI002E14977C|nr:hypothetical protein OG349_15905 [Streptomyces sp. NBC_01317]